MNARQDPDLRIEYLRTKLGLDLVKKTYREASSPCPHCGGNDRFITWIWEGNSWCRNRSCIYHGKGNNYVWDEDFDRDKVTEARQARYEQALKQRERMHDNLDWMKYYNDPRAVIMWAERGINEMLVEQYGLGFVEKCPMNPNWSALTIPFFFNQQLEDIQYRFLPNETGALPNENRQKYASHGKAAITPVFNADLIYQANEFVVVEGAIKALTLNQSVPTVGIPSVTVFQEFLDHLANQDRPLRVTFALDPHTNGTSEHLASKAKEHGAKAYVAHFWDKPDDLFLAHGPDLITNVLDQAIAFS